MVTSIRECARLNSELAVCWLVQFPRTQRIRTADCRPQWTASPKYYFPRLCRSVTHRCTCCLQTVHVSLDQQRIGRKSISIDRSGLNFPQVTLEGTDRDCETNEIEAAADYVDYGGLSLIDWSPLHDWLRWDLRNWCLSLRLSLPPSV